MRSNWLTLVGVGSLGLMTMLGPLNGRVARADDPNSTILGDTTERRHALDLLRQATAALRTNRLEDARRLARLAQDLNAPYSLFDVRPEHILAEVERREQSGDASPKPATATAQETAMEPVPAQKPTSVLAGASEESADPFAQPGLRKSAPTTVQATPAPVAPVSVATAMPTAAPVAAPTLSDQTAAPFAVIKQAPESPPRPQPAPGLGPEQLKARAIAMLDRGLQALDEHRLDDADRYARAALALQAPFGKLEYKPEFLITEVGIARARLRLDALTSTAPPAAQSSQSQRQVLPAPQSQPAPSSQQAALSPPAVRQTYRTQPQWQAPAPTQQEQSGTIMTASASSAGTAAPMTSVMPVPSAVPATSRPAQVAAMPVQTVPSPVYAAPAAPPTAAAVANAQKGAPTIRDRAERMLEAAAADLRAGRDDEARARIQAALSAIYPQESHRLPIFSSEAPITAAGPRIEPPQAGMPRAGFPSNQQSNLPSLKDSVLKPLHDPYLGDEANTTAKSSATENTLRENNVEFTPISNSALSLDRPLPRMSDELPQSSAPPVVAATTVSPAPLQTPPSARALSASQTWSPIQLQSAPSQSAQTQSASDASSPISRVLWPESNAPSSGTATNPATAPVPPAAAPGAVQQQNGRLTFAPYSPPPGDPVSPTNSDVSRPGFFDRVWSAITGER